MALDTMWNNTDVVANNSLWAVWAWLNFWNTWVESAMHVQNTAFEAAKTLALQTSRVTQDVTRTTCDILASSPHPVLSHFAKVTKSYTFNTHKRLFDIPIASSVEHEFVHELADMIHVVPEVINTDIRPKLIIPAASSHDEMLAQDTSAAMTRYGTNHHVLARKSWEELSSEVNTTMNAEIEMLIEAFKMMHQKYPDGFDILAICEGTQVGFIAAMVCLQEYWFAPKNFVWIGAATMPDANPSEVSMAAKNASREDIDTLAVNLPSWVRIIPAELNILNFLSKKADENMKRAFELYTKWLFDEDLTRKGIHQNELMMNGRSFTAANFLWADGELGKRDRYFADPELQKWYGIFNGKEYYIWDYDMGKYIPLGWLGDDIAPREQGKAILDLLPEHVRWVPIEVKWGHYATFTWSNWRNVWYPGIVSQTDGVELDPEIFKNDTLFAA